MAEKTKTLKVKQITMVADHAKADLYAVAEDGSVWQFDGEEWEELPAIEVVEEGESEG